MRKVKRKRRRGPAQPTEGQRWLALAERVEALLTSISNRVSQAEDDIAWLRSTLQEREGEKKIV